MTIICIGNDANVLPSRAAVLETTGAKVIVAFGESALTIVKDEPADLIVVCHSLSEELARRVYETAKARIPTPTVLRLTDSVSQSAAEKHCDAVTSTDPATLARTAGELLKVRQGRARA